MRRIAASFMAMTAGWAVMNLSLLLLALIGGGLSFDPVEIIEMIRRSSAWLMVSSLVVGAAWLFVYLPVFVLVPRSSRFWDWRVCVPVGAVVGAVVPFGLWAIPAALVNGDFYALLFLLMPGTVGAVAAVVGRWLVDWSRNYRDLPMHEFHPELQG